MLIDPAVFARFALLEAIAPYFRARSRISKKIVSPSLIFFGR
jgi:hypothetical protein